jgi:hypothetical protein
MIHCLREIHFTAEHGEELSCPVSFDGESLDCALQMTVEHN